jgi:hypothetical protein
VIVHGAVQDASAPAEVEGLLEAKGHDVEVVNLPGRDAQGDMQATLLGVYRDATRAWRVLPW